MKIDAQDPSGQIDAGTLELLDLVAKREKLSVGQLLAAIDQKRGEMPSLETAVRVFLASYRRAMPDVFS
ncbi:MAG TPA: ribbon-helix-helix domain-containing protein [Arenibaculum sp.]|nr:ribbon-helix-helix domain-containing protein [Arenibaculum sp.]